MSSASRFSVGLATLTAKGRRWHATGHPWVFRDDVARLEEGRGLLVRVQDDAGRGLGLASLSPGSKIALRFLERGPEAEIRDRFAWFRGRLERALRRRDALAGETNACRVVSSEADGLPGLIVDRYADVLVLQSLTRFVEEHLDHIVPLLVELCEPTMVLARNDVRVRRLEGLEERVDLCHGRRTERVEIYEHGLSFVVEPFRGQKTGFYLDQRPARRLIQRIARGRVLDLYCYTGGFALHAARGDADSVLAVDTSRRALEAVVQGAARNGLAGIEVRHGRVPALLKALVDSGERFDVVVLDPPAFAKSRGAVEAAFRGYVDLNRKALRLLARGGSLLTSSCSYNMRPELFRAALAEAATRAGPGFLDRGRLAPARDHPVLLGFPESDYLKVHLLEAC